MNRRLSMNIQGPAGQLEAIYTPATPSGDVTMILCHPHPLYGGNMHDGVLQIAAEVCLSEGINVLRFNFRGVGASEGRHDDGVGEMDDLLAADNWVRQQHGDQDIRWLGYSFGAATVWNALMGESHANPAQVILVAPPPALMKQADEDQSNSIHTVVGDYDDFVDIESLSSLVENAPRVIPGADHFFSAHRAELANQLTALITG